MARFTPPFSFAPNFSRAGAPKESRRAFFHLSAFNCDEKLHIEAPRASPRAQPEKPKKKKFGIGNVMGALGGAGKITGGMDNLGGLGKLGDLANVPGVRSLLGQSGLERLMGDNLTQLLGGQSFALGSKINWMAIAGAALQGDSAFAFFIQADISGFTGTSKRAGVELRDGDGGLIGRQLVGTWPAMSGV